jgi:hypothetical protein
MSHTKLICVFAIVAVLVPAPAPAYSVLTHEALIDAAWDKVDQAPAAGAISAHQRRRAERGPRLRLRRIGHPRSRLLPVRQQVLQQSPSLRALG